MSVYVVVSRAVGALLVAGGVVLAVRGWFSFGRKLRIIRIAKRLGDAGDTSWVSSVILPLCKVAGTVRCEAPVTAGASGLQVAICQMQYRGSGGKERVTAVPFTVKVMKEVVHVDPQFAELDLDATISGRSQLVHESVLRLGVPVFLVGKLSRTADKMTLSNGSDTIVGKLGMMLGYRSWFFISTHSEEHVVERLQLWYSLHLGAAAALGIVGGVLFFHGHSLRVALFAPFPTTPPAQHLP